LGEDADALSWDRSMVHEAKSIVPIPKDRRADGKKGSPDIFVEGDLAGAPHGAEM